MAEDDELSAAELEHLKSTLAGVERRAQIDTETLKALLVINGGGILALLTMSSALLARPGYEGLLRSIFVGIMVLAAGLVFAVIHNVFRRECSRIYDLYKRAPPAGAPLFWGYLKLKVPRACWFSVWFRGLSVACFMVAVLLVGIAGLRSVGPTPPASTSHAPTS